MKKIGFVDYYLGEWHANNYPAWLKSANQELGEDFELAYAWGEIVSPVDGSTSEEWCEKFGVQCCSSIAEVCEKSDFIIVLAPSNPEKHLEYAKQVLSYQKRTYIDKTFAPNYKEAKEMFDIAEKYGTDFFSTSALRYASELQGIENAQVVVTTGGGGSLEEYSIHQIEMIVKLLKAKATQVKVEKYGKNVYNAKILFEGDKSASLTYCDCMPFTVCVECADGSTTYRPVVSDFFADLIKDILKFFKDGKKPFCSEETLIAMKVRERTIEGKSKLGQWLEV